MGRGFDETCSQDPPSARERVLMLDMEIVSTLEVEIVVEHVCSDVDQTCSEQGQEKGGKAECVSQLEGENSREDDRHECCLQEWNAHGLKPEQQERGSCQVSNRRSCQRALVSGATGIGFGPEMI